MSSKISLLLPLLWQQPSEFVDRFTAIIDVNRDKYLRRRPNYPGSFLKDALGEVDQSLQWNLLEYMAEPACQAIAHQVQQAMVAMPAGTAIGRRHNSDFTLARTCYAFCRVLKPQVVIETGVAFGVTSSFILAAMAENQRGKLYSIDLPPLAEHADDFVGILVPEALKSRWQLLRGTSRRLLPELAHSVAPIDLFIHDSLHTYRNISFELDTVTPLLNRPAGILVDDVEHSRAFSEWQLRSTPTLFHVIREEKANALFSFSVFS